MERDAFINKYHDEIQAAIAAGANVNEAINKILYGDLIDSDRISLYNMVYERQGFLNKEDFDLFNSNLRGFTKKLDPTGEYYIYEEIAEIDYLEDTFTVDEKAYEYIRDAIVKKFDFADYDTYEEYVDAVAQYTQTLTAIDPLMQRTVINANLVLANEANVKYLELLDEARKNGALDDPRALENLNQEMLQLIHL